MKVEILSHTSNMVNFLTACAKVCYSDKTDFNEIINDKDTNLDFLKHILDSGHHSPLEHGTISFYISGISRACSHQLVRHRIASYSQKSQRYVSEQGFEFVTPSSVEEAFSGKLIYDEFMEHASKVYNHLIDLGVPKEDARYVLPNACTTSIIVTMNCRSLANFFKLRCCNRAQWETREMANLMLEECQKLDEGFFALFGPSCKTEGVCHEGKFSCKNKI